MGLMDGVNDFGSGQGDVSPTNDLSGIQDYSNGGNYNDAGSAPTNPITAGGDYGTGTSAADYSQILDSVASLGLSDGISSLSSTGNINDIGAPADSLKSSGMDPANAERNGSAESGIGKILSSFMKTINDPGNKMGVALGAQLVQGFFQAPTLNAQRKYYESSAKSNEVRANAEALTAQTNSDIAKQKMANASGIKQTNFGAPQTGLIYTDLLAQRRARSGVTS